MARILVADDSLTDIEFLKSVLSNTGHDFSIARDGEEAEKLAKTESFDLIILDVVMPKKNGFQLCREFKRDEKLKNTPVILLSGKNQQSDILWGQRQGADEYLTKPCEPMKLLLTIKRFLK